MNAKRQIRFLKFDPMVRFIFVVATEPVTDTMMSENCPVQHFLVDIFNPSLSLCGRCQFGDDTSTVSQEMVEAREDVR